MSANRVYKDGHTLLCSPDDAPVEYVSGDAVRVGDLVGIAQRAADNDDNTVVALHGVFSVPVKGEDSDGNAALSFGARLYYKDGNAYLNADEDGSDAFAGWLADVAGVESGATTTVAVKLAH